ncbi:hypothetical protein P0W64_06660 [Tsukamurella sp. 8F]|uniref:DUF6542 domain-containing protein n=1 Tax=unclassified Tsukamurella TaxID=2633480 RepID=UPI0023B92083|nr:MULTISPECIES: DUF6542 domain-containing protein [unclassified Tsukamurella]MDF0530135.1 hypothetical protein [Tsukamurella sp. 8J]MDF0586453.1 hypothetical protein [Tsukamurella sp. 8F]
MSKFQPSRSQVPIDERSVLATVPGLPWWGAILTLAAFTALGALLSAAVSGGHIGSVCIAIGAIVAVLVIRNRALFTAIVQPPLFMALTIPLYNWLTLSDDSSSSAAKIVLDVALPLVRLFPWMFWITVVTAVIGISRWVLYRAATHTARSAARGKPASAPASARLRLKDIAAKAEPKSGRSSSRTVPSTAAGRARRPATVAAGVAGGAATAVAGAALAGSAGGTSEARPQRRSAKSEVSGGGRAEKAPSHAKRKPKSTESPLARLRRLGADRTPDERRDARPASGETDRPRRGGDRRGARDEHQRARTAMARDGREAASSGRPHSDRPTRRPRDLSEAEAPRTRPHRIVPPGLADTQIVPPVRDEPPAWERPGRNPESQPRGDRRGRPAAPRADRAAESRVPRPPESRVSRPGEPRGRSADPRPAEPRGAAARGRAYGPGPRGSEAPRSDPREPGPAPRREPRAGDPRREGDRRPVAPRPFPVGSEPARDEAPPRPASRRGDDEGRSEGRGGRRRAPEDRARDYRREARDLDRARGQRPDAPQPIRPDSSREAARAERPGRYDHYRSPRYRGEPDQNFHDDFADQEQAPEPPRREIRRHRYKD